MGTSSRYSPTQTSPKHTACPRSLLPLPHPLRSGHTHLLHRGRIYPLHRGRTYPLRSRWGIVPKGRQSPAAGEGVLHKKASPPTDVPQAGRRICNDIYRLSELSILYCHIVRLGDVNVLAFSNDDRIEEIALVSHQCLQCRTFSHIHGLRTSPAIRLVAVQICQPLTDKSHVTCIRYR